jgi:hypothetical protein
LCDTGAVSVTFAADGEFNDRFFLVAASPSGFNVWITVGGEGLHSFAKALRQLCEDLEPPSPGATATDGFT